MLPLFLRLSHNTVHKIHGGQTDVDLSVCNGTTVGVWRDGMTMLMSFHLFTMMTKSLFDLTLIFVQLTPRHDRSSFLLRIQRIFVVIAM